MNNINLRNQEGYEHKNHHLNLPINQNTNHSNSPIAIETPSEPPILSQHVNDPSLHVLQYCANSAIASMTSPRTSNAFYRQLAMDLRDNKIKQVLININCFSQSPNNTSFCLETMEKLRTFAFNAGVFHSTHFKKREEKEDNFDQSFSQSTPIPPSPSQFDTDFIPLIQKIKMLMNKDLCIIFDTLNEQYQFNFHCNSMSASQRAKAIRVWMYNEENHKAMQSVLEIKVINGGLTTIPFELSLFPNVRELILDSNNIQQIPPSICELPQLRKLDLDHNLVTEIPSCIGNLKNLLTLSCFNNKLKSIPDEICQLSHLQILKISRNQIKVIPNNIHDLMHLKLLQINKNEFEYLPMGLLTLAERNCHIDMRISDIKKLLTH